MAVEVGNKAPDFTLVNQDREHVTLSAASSATATSSWRFFPARSAARARKRCAASATR